MSSSCVDIILVFHYPRHGSFYGSDGDIEHGYHETGDYLKNLTSHEYEIDMDKQEVLNKEEKASKTSAG